MKNLIITIIIFQISLLGYTQQNLIQNPGFEQAADGSDVDLNNYIICPGSGPNCSGLCVNPDPGNNYSMDSLDAYYAEIFGWTRVGLKKVCVTDKIVKYVGTWNAKPNSGRSGLRCGHGSGREYATQELEQTLSPNSTYYIEVYYRTTTSENDRGILFSYDRPKQCGSSKLNVHGDPHISFNDNSGGTFKKKTLYYKPDGYYSWMTIGPTDDGHGAYMVDDLRIFEIGDDLCADGDWLFQNTDLDEDWAYNASGDIILGRDIMSNYDAYEGDVVVKSGTYIWFKASDVIEMNPGFEVEAGAMVETILDGGCAYFNPCKPEIPNGNNYFSCDTDPITIGPSNTEYAEYSWSPATYLSDPTVRNPVFTPPVNSDGKIEYTLTITPWCGGYPAPPFGLPTQSTAEVYYSVEYHTNPNPNPSVSIYNQTITPNFVEFDVDVAQGASVLAVQIFSSSGQHAFTKVYDLNELGCCSFHWSSDEIDNFSWGNFNVCEDYTIKVLSQNNCYPNNVAEETFIWERSSGNNTPPEIISHTNQININGIGAECLAIETNNADSYDIQIQPSDQIVIYQAFGQPITGDVTCVWDGTCNMNYGTSLYCDGSYGGCADEGYAYFFTLTLHNCYGLSDQDSWFAYLFYGDGYDCGDASGMALWDGGEIDESQNEMREYISESFDDNGSSSMASEVDENFIEEVSIFPNPNDGNFIIVAPNVPNSKIEVLDASGKVVYLDNNPTNFNQVNLPDIAKGLYLVKVSSASNVVTKTIIVD